MKREIVKALELIMSKSQKYEFKTLEENGNIIAENIDLYRLKILFVGGFSAGKSALINAFIGRELLEEDQKPETAVASELMYDIDEYIEAIKDEHSDRFSIEAADSINTKEYDKLLWHLKNENIKKLGDCRIVDTPGFNSGIEEHNKAILQYMGKGNGYILVIDCEEGTFKTDLGSYVMGIKDDANDIGILISKTDLKSEEDIRKVAEGIETDSSFYFGKKIPIKTTSKFDKDAAKKIISLIKDFDKDRIFAYEFADSVYELGAKCINGINVYRNNISADFSAFDEEIRLHERAKEELINSLKREKFRLSDKLKNQAAPAILSDIENALRSRADSLAAAIQNGEHSFRIEVNNILRTTLAHSIQYNIQECFSDFIEEINITANISEMLTGADNISLPEIDTKSIEDLDKTYKTIIASLMAIIELPAGPIVNILQLALLFLPDILKLFGGNDKTDPLRSKVTNEVIPKIVTRIQPEIEKCILNTQEELTAQAEERINSLIKIEIESIEHAKENRAKSEEDHNAKLEEAYNDINEIKTAISAFA